MLRSNEVSVTHMEFHIHFDRDEDYVYAVCDSVPLNIPGRNEKEATAAFEVALDMYLNEIYKRGELESAIETFGIKATTLILDSPVRCPQLELTGNDGSYGRLALMGNAS